MTCALQRAARPAAVGSTAEHHVRLLLRVDRPAGAHLRRLRCVPQAAACRRRRRPAAGACDGHRQPGGHLVRPARVPRRPVRRSAAVHPAGGERQRPAGRRPVLQRRGRGRGRRGGVLAAAVRRGRAPAARRGVGGDQGGAWSDAAAPRRLRPLH